MPPCPNENTYNSVLFILADDIGWNDVGWHGNEQVETPNLDSLVANGGTRGKKPSDLTVATSSQKSPEYQKRKQPPTTDFFVKNCIDKVNLC